MGEVEQSLNAVRAEYPGAVVKASTFDAFIADVMPAKGKCGNKDIPTPHPRPPPPLAENSRGASLTPQCSRLLLAVPGGY